MMRIAMSKWKGASSTIRATLVKAVTERGPGYWVIAPFRTSDGFLVLINRGYVPSEQEAREGLKANVNVSAVTGLLRISEPGGGFLRKNDPAADRWFSRDVDAIAQARGLKNIAPYFIDADAPADPRSLPVRGIDRHLFSEQPSDLCDNLVRSRVHAVGMDRLCRAA